MSATASAQTRAAERRWPPRPPTSPARPLPFLADQAPRGEEAALDLARRGARGDRVAEQVAGDVLAVVLAVAPVRRLSERSRATPVRPLRPRATQPSRPRPQVGREPASRRGRSARRSRGRGPRGTTGHASRLRPQPRRLERDRPGRRVARPDVVPAVPLAGDHRAAARIGERDQDADGTAVEPSRPGRGAPARAGSARPHARRGERAGPRPSRNAGAGIAGLIGSRRLLGRAGDGGRDEDRGADRDDAPLHRADASLCASRRGSSVGRAHD